MILLFVLSGMAILMVSNVVARLSANAHPEHQSKLILGALGTGAVLFVSGLVLWSAPTVLDMVGMTDLALVCRRMIGGFVPGGQVGGLTVAVAAAVIVLAGGRGGLNMVRTQRGLRVETLLAPHLQQEGYDLVVLPTTRQLAYTVGGRRPQIVLSQGLVDTNPPRIVESITAHERVHARRRHHRYLGAAAVIGGAFGWIPAVSRALGGLHLALERWADEEAALTSRGGRAGLRNALLTASIGPIADAVPGFGGPRMVAARIDALAQDPPCRSSQPMRIASLAAGGVSFALLTAVGWTGMTSVVAMANAGRCIF